MRHLRLTALVVLLACLGLASRASAQQRPPSYAEYRADAIVGGGTTAQAGVGAVIPFGVYARLGVDGAAGSTWRDGVARASGRVEAIGRFLLDPYREAPVGLSFGGGVSVPYVSRDVHLRPFLTAVVDIEGRMRGPVTPALQIGLGGGARIGLVLRGSAPRWR
ncbi:MAG: hypothetical protein ABJF01_02050 [bacterium]